MNPIRAIRADELALIDFMLNQLGKQISEFTINEQVEEYEQGKMGSISLGGDPDKFAGDLLQVSYVDTDDVPVIISLTQDEDGKLLDLDFWKEDFSKLLLYPTPDKVEVLTIS